MFTTLNNVDRYVLTADLGVLRYQEFNYYSPGHVEGENNARSS